MEVARTQVSPARGANALLVLPDAGMAWLEAFATTDALARDAATIAADLFLPSEPERIARRVETIAEAVDWIWRRQVVPIDWVRGTLGDAYVFASQRSTGELLLLDGSLAHAAVSASLAVASAA